MHYLLLLKLILLFHLYFTRVNIYVLDIRLQPHIAVAFKCMRLTLF